MIYATAAACPIRANFEPIKERISNVGIELPVL